MLAALFLFCGCSAAELSSLRAFACPYEGEYVCEYARYGGRDLLANYREVVLTLEGDTFTLRALPLRGKPVSAAGACTCDAERGTIALRAALFGREYRKDLVLRGGKIFFSQEVAGQQLVLRFAAR